ncbi:hypothetical protein B0H17DRAFT_1126654 [Mycena rosella]|uniref:Uncharacterized protein n=1 Tax=Mycena rosella TaxID=1033263 RepID=A0AAD7GU02_MYCRO|nr:hypothetical protein B0H17DRAFT_1126654 [Mycena rosella]
MWLPKVDTCRPVIGSFKDPTRVPVTEGDEFLEERWNRHENCLKNYDMLAGIDNSGSMKYLWENVGNQDETGILSDKYSGWPSLGTTNFSYGQEIRSYMRQETLQSLCCGDPHRQLEIQFVQIGTDTLATTFLDELDMLSGVDTNGNEFPLHIHDLRSQRSAGPFLPDGLIGPYRPLSALVTQFRIFRHPEGGKLSPEDPPKAILGGIIQSFDKQGDKEKRPAGDPNGMQNTGGEDPSASRLPRLDHPGDRVASAD